MRCAVRGCSLGACLLVFLSSEMLAAELAVGPDKPYTRIEEALGRAAPGDVIVVHPQADNKPYEKVALAVNTPKLRIKAAGYAAARIPLNGAGGDYSGRGSVPRAIIQFNPGADGCVVEGFELLGAHNDSHNGAGVRINQANDITIRSCSIHDNDMGIMSNGDGTENSARNQLIENCLVYRNGDPLEPGQNHNLYLGGTSVTLRGCEVHSSLTGHNVKSRAHRTLVIACYIHDSASRELDLVDGKGDTTVSGSDAVLAGNIIVKDKDCSGNRAVIHFGQDGGNEHDGTLYLVHNTIVTPFISPVVHLSAPKARTQMFNNIAWDDGAHRNGQVLVLAGKNAAKRSAKGNCNWVSSGFKGPALEALALQQTMVGSPETVIAFTDAGKGDYHLARPDPQVVEKGCALPRDVLQALNGRLLEYKAPQGSSLRPINGKPDLGAVEWRSIFEAEPVSESALESRPTAAPISSIRSPNLCAQPG